jgi:hypothetical protein
MLRKDLGMTVASAASAAIVVIAVYEGTGRHQGGPAQPSAVVSGVAAPAVKPAVSARAGALATEVTELSRRLYAIEKEKSRLEAELARAERELSRSADGGRSHEFDLDDQDWRALASEGTVKYRHPCLSEKGWKPRPEDLELLGLGPDDGETLRAAFRRSYDRVWKTVRPLCAAVLGSADVADGLGPDTCIHVVVDATQRQDGALARDAMREVAETRAGQRAVPAPGAALHPLFQMFWTLTGEMRAFEADLAQTLGPEEAKRVAYAKALCHGQSTFGGAGPRASDH